MSYRRGDHHYGDNNGVVQPLQRGEESDEIRSQQPVKLQPSWEENNLPEDELNFKSLTMDEASLQLNTPPDKYRLVYLTFLIHGIGVLMPWNMFITADKYFTEHKLASISSSSYVTNFMQYLTFAAQVPNVFFNYVNIFIQIGGNLTTRIVWSISLEVIVFVVTVILAMIDTSSWPVSFFWMTIVCVIVLNMANGIYQNTIFGMAAKLPGKYTGAVVLGSNISGTFTSVVSILSKKMSSNKKMAAIYYFITALFVLLICFDTYFALPLNRFYRHHELKEKKDAEQRKQLAGRTQRIPYLYILKQALPQLYNVFFIFFVTLSIFPAIHANVRAIDPDFILSDPLDTDFFPDMTCFLTFNVCAMIGSYLTSFIRWPGPKFLWIFVTLRVFYIPFFLFCNYQLGGVDRRLPVLVTNDYVYWLVAITMGVSSGYFSSLGMMYAPRTVEERYAATAGMFAAAALITGIFTGIISTFLWPWVIEHVGY